jgi:uncharacterized protein (TIGR03435 family)
MTEQSSLVDLLGPAGITVYLANRLATYFEKLRKRQTKPLFFLWKLGRKKSVMGNGTSSQRWCLRVNVRLLMLSLAFVALVSPLQAQPRPEFEVATVKLSAAVQPGVGIPINLGTYRNGLLTLTNTTLTECLQFAYNIVSDTQIVGPDWIRTRDVRFDVVGKTDPETSRDQALVMLQNLLAERLKVVLHRENKELSFLALIPGREGPKLSPAKEVGAAVGSQVPGRILHPRMPMFTLATLLSRFERQLVIDQTGLHGPFTVDLQWLPDTLRSRLEAGGPPPVVNGQPVDVNLPSLYTAVQEQLGLRLESRKGPVDVLVIDQAERVPTEN